MKPFGKKEKEEIERKRKQTNRKKVYKYRVQCTVRRLYGCHKDVEGI